ncbi:MAG TPA: UvrD-helicase domain-containing protein [Gammaproteobacteria bacterium]|nr:UvrD-helicase domain-containing protein [Gammaproteobacteria bacterium]
MHPEEQAEYRQAIAEEIAAWAEEARREGDAWWPAVERTPAWFDALVLLAERPELSDHERRIVHRVIKYLVSPLDLMPEFIYGPKGFREDLALIAEAVERLRASVGEAVLAACGFDKDDPGLKLVEARAEHDIEDDVRYHLHLLLEADAVAGDEELAHAAAGSETEAPADNPGPHTMVFAGPGTGKTYRLETELARLLLEERVPAQQILVTTFTNKAADELRVRVRRRLAASEPETAVNHIMQQLAISTIHAFCFRLISEFHHHALFLKGAHAPMDETQRMLLLFRHGIGKLRLKDIYPDWQAEQRALSGWHPTDLFNFYAHVGEVYDFLSEDVVKGADKELRHRYLQLIQEEPEEGSVDERIIHSYPRYWRLVQEEGFLDHSMTLAYAEALLDDPQVRARVQARFRHVLVDEYQDTNPIQDRIFRAIAAKHGRLFAVGDDDQSIYAFRGADVRNATEFAERWPGAAVERLEENRRSTARLVAGAQALIRRNTIRQPKDLFTQNPEGVPPWRVEADWDALPEAVADALIRMKASGAFEHWDEVALLFRGLTGRVPLYRQALAERDIPSALTGDRRFLARPLVKGLMKTLAMVADDPEKITNRKRAHRPFFEALGWTDRAAMLEAIREWNEGVQEGRFETLLELFYTIVNDTSALGDDTLLPDLGHLSGFIAAAEAQLTSPDLKKRLKYFLRYAEAAAASFAGPVPQAEDEVQIMTIHKAKGLEFPVVIVADAVEGCLPAGFGENTRDRLRQRLAGLAPRLDPVEEERRVLYVALTRAERYALLATDPKSPSPYLKEFDNEPFPERLPEPSALKPFYDHAAHGVPPLHLHHSGVYDYHFCPRRYLLADACGFASQVIAPVRAGQTLHRALEIYHRLKADGEQVTPERRERIFERAWVRPRDTKKAKKEYEQLFGVFDTFAGQWEDEYDGRRTRVIETEQPFYAAEGSGVLAGKIDLVRERDDRLEIVELKFHQNPMMPDYPSKQLEHYSLAYPDEHPRLVVHYLKENRMEEIHGREPEAVREELAHTFEDIRARRFPAQDKPALCRLCPVRFACAQRASG